MSATTSTTSTTALEIVTDPEMDATCDGIPVSGLGEDGGMVALGHPGEARALAAFERYAREYLGLPDLADRSAGAVVDISELWVVVRRPDPARPEEADWPWAMEEADQGAPGARPVTYLTVY